MVSWGLVLVGNFAIDLPDADVDSGVGQIWVTSGGSSV